MKTNNPVKRPLKVAAAIGAIPHCLTRAAKALALSRNRDYCVPDDIKELAPIVLPHRVTVPPRRTAETRQVREANASALAAGESRVAQERGLLQTVVEQIGSLDRRGVDEQLLFVLDGKKRPWAEPTDPRIS